jgi:hypothetical protein
MNCFWLKQFSSIAVIAAVIIPTPLLAYPRENVQGTYQVIDQQKAEKSAITTLVYPGRITTIDFSIANETLVYIGLGDASKVVFNTDFPLEKGMAKTIFLKPIVPLKFSGATTAKITNLVVKTIDSSNQSRLYNFQIVHVRGNPTNLGIQIVPSTRHQFSNAINIGNGRTATLDEVETGLRWALARGYTAANDPVVFQVKNFLAIARNQDLSLAEAVQSAGLELAVITELARLAFEVFQPQLNPSRQDSVLPQERQVVQFH